MTLTRAASVACLWLKPGRDLSNNLLLSRIPLPGTATTFSGSLSKTSRKYSISIASCVAQDPSVRWDGCRHGNYSPSKSSLLEFPCCWAPKSGVYPGKMLECVCFSLCILFSCIAITVHLCHLCLLILSLNSIYSSLADNCKNVKSCSKKKGKRIKQSESIEALLRAVIYQHLLQHNLLETQCNCWYLQSIA